MPRNGYPTHPGQKLKAKPPQIFKKGNKMDEKEKAVMDAGIQYGMQMLQQMPKGNQLEMEAHITGVLCAFWGALWGTFGTKYARGFIEAQLRGMETDVQHKRFTC